MDKLAYKTSGKGFPLVLIHGFLENDRMWKAFLPDFESHFKVVNICLFGHGNSPVFKGKELTLNQMAEAVLDVLISENIKTFMFVGHSLGGYVGLYLHEMLDEHNMSISKMVLLNSHPWEDSPTKKQEREQVAQVVQKAKGHFLGIAIPALYANPDDFLDEIDALIFEANEMEEKAIVDATIAMKNRTDKSHVLSEMKQELLVIQGELDHMIPCDKMQLVCKQNENAFLLVENAGHMSYHENSTVVLNGVLSHLLT